MADSDDSGAHGETPVSGFRAKSRTRDEENLRFSRACLVEKWMEKEIVAKKLDNILLQDNDSLFFSSTPTYSDSSGALSSSDSDFFGSSTARPKPVRTGLSPHRNECGFFDDYQNYEKYKVEEDSIKSKSRASKIYTKLKQPMSPGAKLTSLISSFFARKKTKNVDKKKMCQEMSSPDKTTSLKCSSASSFSRSCLSKNSSKSSDAARSVKSRDGIQRTVRFRLDQDAKPCGEKNVYDEGYDRYGRPPLPPKALKVHQRKCDFSMFRKIHNAEDEDEDHAFSESSSDLFELDHLSLFGNKDRFYEELPVYETTYFDRNRGLVH